MTCALLIALLSCAPVAADTPLRDAAARVTADTFAVAEAPTVRERVDVALGITSLSASSIAIGLTAACVSDGSCRELNPVMRKWLGESRSGAIIGKAVIGGVTHYAVYRFIPKGKVRTVALAVLAGINVLDAGHDISEMRKIDR